MEVPGENDEVNPEEPDVNGEPKEYMVSLGMTGEIEVSESPLLGRASSDDLYGVQVYYKTETTDYIPYAYGLFDDKSGMNVKLLEGYKYRFSATMIVNGKNKLSHSGNIYNLPFFLQQSAESIKLLNKFTYDQGNVSCIHWGNSSLAYQSSSKIFSIPNTDRYYGETKDYSPIENGNVSINMKRVVFGTKFIADGLNEGKLIIRLKEAPELYIENGTTEVEEIFTFKNANIDILDWTKDDYTETIPLSISWEKADGAIVPLINKDITFKRKTLSTITIKVKDSSVNNGVEINQESGDLIAGDNITIASGTGTDTPVDPNI